MNYAAYIRKYPGPNAGVTDISANDFDVRVFEDCERRQIWDGPMDLRAQIIEQQHLPTLLDEHFGSFKTDEAEAAGD